MTKTPEEQGKERQTVIRGYVNVILPFQVLEKIVDKPLRIRGIAMTAGMSRNFNIYTPEELQAFAQKLVSAPVYVARARARRNTNNNPCWWRNL